MRQWFFGGKRPKHELARRVKSIHRGITGTANLSSKLVAQIQSGQDIRDPSHP
jgi:hypothetical protein